MKRDPDLTSLLLFALMVVLVVLGLSCMMQSCAMMVSS